MSADRHSNGPFENPNGISVGPNFSSSSLKKNNGVEAKRNRGDRDKDQITPPAAKRTNPSEGNGKKSQSDLEELVAQTYAKGISILHQKHRDDDTRRSKSKKKKKKKAEKSGEQKKFPQTWSAEDETSLANALLVCAGGEGQVNMAAFYEQAKDALGFDISNTQLYDKMRRMRSRFWTIHSKISEGSVPEDQFAYRSPNEAALFKVWKQIWGINVKDHHEEEDLHNTGQNNWDYFIRDEDHRPNESRAPVVENMMEEVQSNIEALINNFFRRISAAANLQPFSSGFGAKAGNGSCLCSNLSGRMKELIEGVRSVKEFPWLDEAEARALQQKWHNNRVEELRVFRGSLELLQEECKLCLKELEK